MTHLTRDDLLHWRATGAPEDRGRVLAHLTACGECRRVYADLVRLEPETIASADLDANVFVKRGIAVYDRRNAPAWWKRRALWLAVPAAAAAMVLVALNLPRPPAPLNEPSAEMRGGSLAAVTPAGAVDRVTEFRWTSPFTAFRYRVVVRDAGGQEVLRRETDQPRLGMEPGATAAFRPDRYTWFVEALDRNGQVLTTSRPQSFQIN